MAQPKGRPTPKRSDARAAKRKPLVAAKSPAGRGGRRSFGAMRQAMRDGDERNYPPVAAGPERALVRDVIDRRRSAGSIAIPGWVLGMALTLSPFAVTRALASILFPLLLVTVLTDSFAAIRAVRRALDEHFPEGTKAPRRALISYGVARNTQFRRQRLPRPRVSPGSDAVTP